MWLVPSLSVAFSSSSFQQEQLASGTPLSFTPELATAPIQVQLLSRTSCRPTHFSPWPRCGLPTGLRESWPYFSYNSTQAAKVSHATCPLDFPCPMHIPATVQSPSEACPPISFDPQMFQLHLSCQRHLAFTVYKRVAPTEGHSFKIKRDYCFT